MKRMTALLALGLLIFSLSAAAQTKADNPTPEFDKELAQKLGADQYGMRNYVHVLLKTGPVKVEDKEERGRIFAGHFANMGRLAEEGKLVMAGPFDDPEGVLRGMFVFDVTTIEEARSLVESDPAVKAGIFRYEMTKLYSSAALKMINEVHKSIQKTEIN